VRDRRTRRQRYEELEDDLTYAKKDLDERVLVPNQIRTVLQAYRDALPTQLFPDRTEVLKTLIFAKDDHHAEEIVQIARDVFSNCNEFCKKITYRAAGKPEELLKEFDVRSANYFEQLRGRAVRTINTTDLRQVTPDAKA
jgi:type I restriction enzyme, R subunit